MVSRIVIRSSRASRSISAHMTARASGSSPVVGSSRNSTDGECSSPSATSSRRSMPPEYVFTCRFAASLSPKRSSISSARTRGDAIP